MSRRGAKKKGFQAAIKFGGHEYFLGRWPSRNAAELAKRRARRHFRPNDVGEKNVAPASPEQLRAEVLALAKQRTSSRFFGVTWSLKRERWVAVVAVKRRSRLIGYFENEKEAALARDRVALKLLGRKARLNFPAGTVRPASLESVRVELRERRKQGTSSRYVGVYRDTDVETLPWVAALTADYAELPIGRYRTEREAAIAHDRAALFHRPKRMVLNFPKLAPKLVPASVLELSNTRAREMKKQTLSRFFGVSWNGFSFVAQIQHQRRHTYLGSFDTEEEAAAAYDQEALRLRGPNTRLNFDPYTGDELIGRRA